jgi:glucosamine 6-phosphate synthetase-like amidotransferase/phosphosugar isomerase protein
VSHSFVQSVSSHAPLPLQVNCHPHLSDVTAEFTVVHNGIITNCRDLRALLEGKGYAFVSDTDTESIAVLIKYAFVGKTASSLLTFSLLQSSTFACSFLLYLCALLHAAR